MSFPTRERGLKLKGVDLDAIELPVVPHAGTWIEIGATEKAFATQTVVPHAGTWIEIVEISQKWTSDLRRSPRGNVD